MTAIAPTANGLDALERARAGDHDAFAELVEEHEAMVFSIAFHFFNDRGRAEEIAQDVFLQMYRSVGTIESRSHLVSCRDETTERQSNRFSRGANHLAQQTMMVVLQFEPAVGRGKRPVRAEMRQR